MGWEPKKEIKDTGEINQAFLSLLAKRMQSVIIQAFYTVGTQFDQFHMLSGEWC